MLFPIHIKQFKLKKFKFKSLQLNFLGVTVVPESYYVHVSSTKHLFEPVAIGGSSPPLQLYELYNGGAKPVTYEISMDPLAQVEAVSKDLLERPLRVLISNIMLTTPGKLLENSWNFEIYSRALENSLKNR